MMMSHLGALLEAANEALLAPADHHTLRKVASDHRVGASELSQLLSVKNGFYAFEFALLVRPVMHAEWPLGLIEWNLPATWKSEYEGILDDYLCFAEDVFGGQFALGSDAVVAIDPETGDVDVVAPTLEAWAHVVLSDYGYRTGYAFARDWQRLHGPLPLGCRLVPKIPFVAGGEFSVDNLYLANELEAMRFRADIARQLRGVPDGGHIVFQVSGGSMGGADPP